MRQFAGFGTAEETNERFRYLLDHGQTGLSTAFDMPSLMGHDSDHAMSLGEVGREGVAIDTLDDMEDLFAGIDLGEVSVSMTINAPAAIMLAYYVVAAEDKGIGPDRLSGHDPGRHPQGVHRPEGVVLPDRPGDAPAGRHDRVVRRERMPRWHPVSISGYHIREAGSTAAQELAFTLKDGFTYVEQAIDRGLDVDDFAPRLSFFFNAHIDFFEEIAKLPRRPPDLGARAARDVRRAQPALVADAHARADGGRVAHRPAAAQQHHAHGDRGARRRARRHPVAAHELLRRGARAARPRRPCASRCARSRSSPTRPGVDEHDRPARRLVLRRGADRRARAPGLRVLRAHRRARRDGRGGQAELPAARDRRRELRAADRDRLRPALGRRRQRLPRRRRGADPHAAHRPRARAQADRARAGGPRAARRRGVEAELVRLREAAARDGENLMPHLLDAARAHCSEGEIVVALQDVWGDYRETPVF